MKKLFLGVALVATAMLSAQETEQKPTARENAKVATQEGNIMIGVNTTSLGFANIDKATSINAGVTAGAFAKDNFAVVATVGYQSNLNSGSVNTNDWYYGAGLKYYIGLS